jgi:hypothetical protein
MIPAGPKIEQTAGKVMFNNSDGVEVAAVIPRSGGSTSHGRVVHGD